MNINSAEGVPWDLKKLYRGQDDPSLLKDMRKALDRAEKFAVSYKGRRANDLDGETLLAALREYELIHEIGMKPCFFATLLFSGQTRDHGRRELLDEIREKWNEIERLLVPFRLEIMSLPEHHIRVLTEYAGLTNYRHFLLHLHLHQPFALKENEEVAAARKELTERTALSTRYDEITGALSIPVTQQGNERSLKIDEVMALLHSHVPAPRARAFDSMHQAIGDQGGLFKDILNGLVMNANQDSRRRGHPFPMHKSLLSNGVEEPMIEAMLSSVEKHYTIAGRYFRLKSGLLGLEKMAFTDRFLPLGQETNEISFAQARSVLLASMETFHPLFVQAARDFFDEKTIDAEVRPGKINGAFCKSFAPSLPPYISMNYSGHLRDLMVLAHEIGHGIHFALSRGQPYLNYKTPPVLSETAATFAEMIVMDHLLGERAFQAYRKNLLACHIEGIITTVFRQTVLTRFEQAIHRLAQDHLLSEEEICQCWWEKNQKLYGNAVVMPDLYRWGWACVPHFFHQHFYCYNYIFGNLCAILLFHTYRDRPGFAEDVIGFFSKGGSEGPLAIFQEMGFDFNEASIWDPSFAYLDTLIGFLKNLEDENLNTDYSSQTRKL
ncbi:MAG: hypothetical protein JRJ82_08115 [Deltaproteobacteria bacterium]|nr:hypothetical protein [Deltaproteobacteria bacterium]